MLLKIAELGKAFGALVNRTRERLLLRMCAQVVKEIVPLLEHKVTVREFTYK